MVWPYIALALGSIVGYELLKTWLESQTQTTEELKVSPAIIIALILLAVYLLSR